MVEAYSENEITNHQIVLNLGPTPDLLVYYGFRQLPVGLTGKVVDKAYFDHGVTKSNLERAYKIIQEPRAIYKSKVSTDAAILLAYEVNNAR